MNQKLDHALKYASLGWHVLPLHFPTKDGRCSCGNEECKNVGKHPRRVKFDYATTDHAQIRKWWKWCADANVGVITGEVSGIMIIDVDNADALYSLIMKLGELPRTVQARTGSGGTHFIVKHPGFAVKTVRGDQVNLPGLDIRGERGLFVAPPSNHKSGGVYEWIVSPFEQEPAELPPKWIEWLRAVSGGTHAQQKVEVTIKDGQHQQGKGSVIIKDTERLSMDEIFSYWRNTKLEVKDNGEIRFDCPVHGGDNDSLSVNAANGLYHCFNDAVCGVSGTIREVFEWQQFTGLKVDEYPGQWLIYWANKKGLQDVAQSLQDYFADYSLTQKRDSYDEELIGERTAIVQKYQEYLTPTSPAANYIEKRGFPLAFVKQFGFGYAPSYEANRLFGSKNKGFDRLIVPQTTPDGRIVNIYGRVISDAYKGRTEKAYNMTGKRGIFNAKALLEDTVVICEGVWDALVWLFKGYNACALFGSDGIPWHWVKAHTLVLCLDRDAADKQKQLAEEASMQGLRVYIVPDSIYQGYEHLKDINELWVATRGNLELERIMEAALHREAEQEQAVTQEEPLTNEDEPQATWEDWLRYVDDIKLKNAHLKGYAVRKKDKYPDLLKTLEDLEWRLDLTLKTRNIPKLITRAEELEAVYKVIRQVRDEEQHKEWALFIKSLHTYLPDHKATAGKLSEYCVGVGFKIDRVEGVPLPSEALPEALIIPVNDFKAGRLEPEKFAAIIAAKLKPHLEKDYDGLCIVRDWTHTYFYAVPYGERHAHMERPIGAGLVAKRSGYIPETDLF